MVTKTLFLDEEVNITIKDVRGWKGFFLGDEIRAQGLVRVDLGVDLSNLSEEDIKVDIENNKIELTIANASILDTSLSGTLDIENQKGIWTNISDFFLENESDDYNRAIEDMIKQTIEAAQEEAKILTEAQDNTVKLLELIVGSSAPDFEVVVVSK